MFRSGAAPLVERFDITIERMRVLAPCHAAPVMAWLAGLPYPWCSAEAARSSMPDLAELADVDSYLSRPLSPAPA